MTTTEKPRVVNLSVDHGQYGDESRAQLAIDRRLRSGKLDFIEMSEDDLVKLIKQAADALAILRGIR